MFVEHRCDDVRDPWFRNCDAIEMGAGIAANP